MAAFLAFCAGMTIGPAVMFLLDLFLDKACRCTDEVKITHIKIGD